MPCFAVSFQLQSDFFGLTSSYKPELLKEIYVLVHHCGFSRSDVMIMPIYERRIYIEELRKELEEKQKAQKAAMNKSKRSR